MTLSLKFTYDQYGLLASAQRGARIETYGYARELGISVGDFNLVNTLDANGNGFSYVYFLPGVVVSPHPAVKHQDMVSVVQYPDGRFASFTYLLQRIVTDLNGNDTTYVLNNYGNPVRIEEPLGKVTKMTWSIDQGLDDNVMTSKTDPLDNTTIFQYDGNGNVTLETDPYGNSIATTWNQTYNLPESRRDRNNVTQTWQYDQEGNLLQHTDGDHKIYMYTYSSTGERQTMTTPRGRMGGYTTSYTYDQYGNPDTVTEPDEDGTGSVTDYDHDVRGRRVAVTDPRGNKTVYTYDDLDYPDKIIHPPITAHAMPEVSSNIQAFDYDPVGNLLSEKNRVGLTRKYTYTPRNQVKTITRSTGGTHTLGTQTFDYDGNGNLISETDWKGVATTHGYDALNRRVSTTNRFGLRHTMHMAYDLAGNLTSVTDYEGRVTDYAYDKLNRLTDTWQPALNNDDRGHIQQTYYKEADPKTNLKSATDQEGHGTAYEYNGRYLRTKRVNAREHMFTWEYDDNGNLMRETDEEGKSTSYRYDAQNRMTSAIRMGEIQTRYEYDTNGNRTRVIDPLGRVTETLYDDWNRPYKIIDPDNYATISEYDGEGNKVKLTDGNGNVRSWTYDPRGLVVSAVDAERNTTSYTYDLNNNVLMVTDAAHVSTVKSYDAEDRETSTIIEGKGITQQLRTEVLSRDRMGNPLEVKDFNGNITRTEYNAIYLPYKVYDAAENATETAYYKTGKVKSVKDRRGHSTTHEYDVLNREIRVTDARKQTIETSYDKVGNVKTVKDKRGIVTESFYDGLYRLTRVEKAGVRLKSNEYDNAGNLTAVIDANGNRIEQTYNGRNLLTATKHPDNTTEGRTYDGVGNLLTLTDEEGKVTTYTYDRENRQTSVELAGEKTAKTYDAVGNLVSITKPEGNKRTMEYDGLKRLAKVVEDPGGLNLTTRYEYDGNGNLRHQYDARGNHVEFTYDSLNRKSQHIQHKAGGNLVTRYTYDEEGNVASMTDAKGQTFTYAYDELNRQTDTYLPAVASPFYGASHISTEYDANNNVTKITENKPSVTDVTSNSYDSFDRLEQRTQRGLTVSYQYDNNGNRMSVATPSGLTTYTFDGRNRLKTASASGGVTTFTYYPDGKQNTVTYPNGTEMKHTYHPSDRVKTITNKVSSSGALISSYAYEYDRNGNRTSQVEIQNGVTDTTTYTYDAVDRLKDFTLISGTNTTVAEYTFEGYNRRAEKLTENGSVLRTKTYHYDETDWLTKVDDTGKTITYEYDDNGNTTRKSDSSVPSGDAVFVYDSRNQLVEAKRGPPGSETILGRYDYNSEGLRVRHRNSERGDVDYYYDDDAVIEERNAANNGLLAHYRYADRLISIDTGASAQYYHYDALGSTVNLTNATGGTQTSYKLDPWGHINLQIGTSLNRHIFTGQEHDENTGLIYFGARYYDADSGRFITQDSYLGESATPPSLHRYLYAYSSPVVYIDLRGYASEKTSNVEDTAEENTEASKRRDGKKRSGSHDEEDISRFITWKAVTGEDASGRNWYTQKRIVVDPPHGGWDLGAGREGIYERDIGNKLTALFVEELERAGHTVYLTRDLKKDSYVRDYNKDGLVGYESVDFTKDTKEYKTKHPKEYAKKFRRKNGQWKNAEQTTSILDRLKFIKDRDPDFSFSPHLNATEDRESKESGIELLTHKGIAKSLRGETEAFIKSYGKELRTRGYEVNTSANKIYQKELGVISGQMNARPAVLGEFGYLSNKEERKKLQQESYLRGIAQAFSAAISKFDFKTQRNRPTAIIYQTPNIIERELLAE